MKSLFLFMLFAGASYNASAQDKPAPEQYAFGQRHLFFEDNFDDDRNGWLDTMERDDKEIDPASSDSVRSKYTIKDGYYDYQVIEGRGTYALGIPLVIDQQKDFEIELSVKLEARKKHNTAGVLLWGRLNMEHCTYLYMHTNGVFSIVSCNEKCTTKRRRLKNFAPGNFNKITLRRYRDLYYLFVNEAFVGTFPFQPLKGKKLGLGAGTGGHMICDYIKLSYLD